MAERGNRTEALGCAAVALLGAACWLIPLGTLVRGPPEVAGIAALLSQVAWIRWGPPPMPGLVPGLVGLTLLCTNGTVLLVSLGRLLGWLA